MEKGRFALVPGADWDYPANRDGAAALSLGVWGIEIDGELAVVLNDGVLLRNWDPDMGAAEAQAQGRDLPIKRPRLMAATNVVVYALTRPHGLALRQGGPAGP